MCILDCTHTQTHTQVGDTEMHIPKLGPRQGTQTHTHTHTHTHKHRLEVPEMRIPKLGLGDSVHTHTHTYIYKKTGWKTLKNACT